ncbi:hypothetical protein BGZ61DRAFT_463591 [Ilyonectria robusta]|uniref:uncharacterized protein n=1 Tax=Ilyonectria robusta TaxID=1079257 RepID=UPI001E8D9F5E|nr:uncharacterized protein BGZ61DRAFT_463591 [Ilyonectria robusta]KAH8661755.1 hypothetical protein BGZ61DRAFT_463591 [Ilyonectria robusta]
MRRILHQVQQSHRSRHNHSTQQAQMTMPSSALRPPTAHRPAGISSTDSISLDLYLRLRQLVTNGFGWCANAFGCHPSISPDDHI